MSHFSGEFTIDGRAIKWDRMSAGGFAIRVGGLDIHLTGEPSEDRIRDAIAGWNQGYSAGKHDGRSILQNEFRNLMQCQPR